MNLEANISAEKRVCGHCVNEPYLITQIETDDQTFICSYCNSKAKTWKVKQLAERVETAFEQPYRRTSDQPDGYEAAMMADKEISYEWSQDGEETRYAIMNALNCSQELADDLAEILKDQYADFDRAAIGEQCEFEDEVHYAEKPPTDLRWLSGWWKFEKKLKNETRFFNNDARDYLEDVFNDIETMRTHDDQPVIVVGGAGTKFNGFYRARVFYDHTELEKAMMRPDLHLAPPPSNIATAGRMNAHGVSVFYGADTAEGAVAEVRPPAGSKVLVGKFEVLSSISILDIGALSSLRERGSIFDPEYADKLTRANFMRILRNEMSRPVMPTDEDLKYLPTQAIIDFLANGLPYKLDGVLFPSAQTNGETTNVVLFHRSSAVQKNKDLDGLDLSARTYADYEDGPVSEYSVYEEQSSEEQIPDTSEDDCQFDDFFMLEDNETNNGARYTMRVDMKFLVVHEVQKIKYKTDDFPVSRTRYTRSQVDDF